MVAEVEADGVLQQAAEQGRARDEDCVDDSPRHRMAIKIAAAMSGRPLLERAVGLVGGTALWRAPGL